MQIRKPGMQIRKPGMRIRKPGMRMSLGGGCACESDGPEYLGIVSCYTGFPEVVLSPAWSAHLHTVDRRSPETSAWTSIGVPEAMVVVKTDSVLPLLTRKVGSTRIDTEPQGGGLAPIRVVDLLAVEVEVLSDGGIGVNGRQ
jgi:hypothetical protein